MNNRYFSWFAILSSVIVLLILSNGCYTRAFKNKVSRKTWRKYHRYQYHSNTDWGKEWNSYYWTPSKNDMFHLLDSGSSSETQKSSSQNHRSNYSDECIDLGCLFIDSGDCCLFPFIGGSDNDDDSDDDSDNPRRRRGMQSSSSPGDTIQE